MRNRYIPLHSYFFGVHCVPITTAGCCVFGARTARNVFAFPPCGLKLLSCLRLLEFEGPSERPWRDGVGWSLPRKVAHGCYDVAILKGGCGRILNSARTLASCGKCNEWTGIIISSRMSPVMELILAVWFGSSIFMMKFYAKITLFYAFAFSMIKVALKWCLSFTPKKDKNRWSEYNFLTFMGL